MMKMTLAKALRKRAELVQEMGILRQRITEAVVYKDRSDDLTTHTARSEAFSGLFDEVKKIKEKLLALKLKVDATNHVELEGETVFGLLVKRGELKDELSAMNSLRHTVYNAINREAYGNVEQAETFTNLSISAIDLRCDLLRKQIREVDDSVCELNGKLTVEVSL